MFYIQKSSSSAKYGGRHFWRVWATFQKIPIYATVNYMRKEPGRSQNKKMIAKIQTSKSKALVAHKNGDMYLYKYIWRSLTKAVPDPNVLYLTETLCNHCFWDIWSWQFNLYVYENNAPIIHHLNGIDPGIETLGVGTCDLETRTLRIELVTHRLLVSWD